MKLQSLILKLHSVEHQINSILEQIEVVKNLPYYENFDKKAEKEFDLIELKSKAKDLMSIKDSVLDKMTIAINLEKADNSYSQRDLVLSDFEITKIN